MITSKLIEIIFKGIFLSTHPGFLSKLLIGSKELRFNSPEVSSNYNSYEVINIFQTNDYVDLVIITDKLEVNAKSIKNVFINICRNDTELKVLLYFDLNDVAIGTDKDNIDYLKSWTNEFMNKYNFEYFICQMDNANEDEYYFDTIGLGPLYSEITG
jgi:hypothetical protein